MLNQYKARLLVVEFFFGMAAFNLIMSFIFKQMAWVYVTQAAVYLTAQVLIANNFGIRRK